MWPPGSRSLAGLGARHDPARRLFGCGLLALLCLALAASIEAPAQTASPEIEEIQRRLADLGYDAGDADGLLGPRTRAALGAFQADQGLPATGLPDATTRRALFGAEPPGPAADTPPPTGDPPSLAAVPLAPVEVAPLAPLAGGSPQEGFSLLTSLADQQGETRPEVRKDRGWTLSQADRTAGSGRGDDWPKWAAAALATFGALALLAAARLRSARPEAAEPQPADGGSPRPVPSARPAATTTVRGGHVFGVDVPPSLMNEPEWGRRRVRTRRRAWGRAGRRGGG